MRDILITLAVFGSLPYIFKKPHIGILMWIWISVMNPHRLSYGFAYTFPFAAIIAGTTMLSIVFTREEKKLPMTPVVVTLILFMLWMCVTTVFSMYQDDSV